MIVLHYRSDDQPVKTVPVSITPPCRLPPSPQQQCGVPAMVDTGLTTMLANRTHMVLNTTALATTSASYEGQLSPVLPYSVVWTHEVISRVVTICVLMFLTVVGNTSLVLVITCCPRQRRKRVNLFLLNLALGDLMVCFVTMTTEILFVAFGEWVLGAVACKLIVYLQMVTLSSATFLLTAMSIDRYQVLVQPLRSLAGRPAIWRKVLVAWAAAFVFSLPQLFIFVQTDDGIYPSGEVKHGCRSQGYTAPWQRKVYFTFLTTYILLVPAIIMTFCYCNIIRVVWTRTDSAGSHKRVRMRFVPHRRSTKNYGSSGESRENCRWHRNGQQSQKAGKQSNLRIPKKLISSSKRKVVKMTLSVIVGFLVCWTPYFVICLIRIYSESRQILRTPLAVAETLGLVHSALNPVLYGFFNSRMRLVQLWRAIRCQYTGVTERYDDGISETETTWSTYKYAASETKPSLCQTGVCCFKNKRLKDTESKSPHAGLYHELRIQKSDKADQKSADSESDRSNMSDGSVAASLRDTDESKTRTVYTSLVFRNPYARGNDNISAV